jgi:hypothetical protein
MLIITNGLKIKNILASAFVPIMGITKVAFDGIIAESGPKRTIRQKRLIPNKA